MEQVKKAAIVLAAGHGKRMHSKVAKQYLLLNGEPVLVHALRAFEMSWMDTIILVTGADEVEFCRKDILWTGRSLRAQWMAPAAILPAWQRCR